MLNLLLYALTVAVGRRFTLAALLLLAWCLARGTLSGNLPVMRGKAKTS